MPNLDLSAATAVRFGNSVAQAVRIANQTIWTKPAEYTAWVESRRNFVTVPRPSNATGIVWFRSGWGTGGAGTDSFATGAGYLGMDAVQMQWTTAPTAGGAGLYVGRSNVSDNPVTAGQQYTGSLYFESNAAETNVLVRLQWFNSSGGSISTSDGSTTSVAANTLTRISHTATAPAGAVRVQIQVRKNAVAGTPVGRRWRASGGLLELGSSVGTYFDGETTDADLIRYSWAGTTNASQSFVETRSLIP